MSSPRDRRRCSSLSALRCCRRRCCHVTDGRAFACAQLCLLLVCIIYWSYLNNYNDRNKFLKINILSSKKKICILWMHPIFNVPMHPFGFFAPPPLCIHANSMHRSTPASRWNSIVAPTTCGCGIPQRNRCGQRPEGTPSLLAAGL